MEEASSQTRTPVRASGRSRHHMTKLSVIYVVSVCVRGDRVRWAVTVRPGCICEVGAAETVCSCVRGEPV